MLNQEGFNRAANAIHISQSALSRQIMLLEEELGVQLFERNARGILLTEAGEVLYGHIDPVLHQLENIRSEVCDVASEPSGELNIGLPYSMRLQLTTPVLIEFQRRYPSVFINYMEGTSTALRESLLKGELDIGILSSNEATPILEVHPLMKDQMYLVGPSSAKLSMNQPIGFAETAEVPLIMPSYPASFRTALNRELSQRDIEPNILMEVNSPLIMDLVSEGVGYSALSYFSIHDYLENGKVSAAPINDFHMEWILVTSRERPVTQANRVFQSMLQERVKVLIATGLWGKLSVLSKSEE